MIALFVLLIQLAAAGRVDRSEMLPYACRSIWPFGSAVAVCGDVDGDGVDEFAVSTPRPVRVTRGRVQLFSGAEGRELRSWSGIQSDGLFGLALVAADLDGDERRELLVGEPWPGRVVAFATGSGREVLQLRSGLRNEDFGWSLDAGDVTGDGSPEVVVGGPSADEGRGIVYVFARTGRLLACLQGERSGDRFGWSVDARADFDGDGASDIVVGAPRADGAGAVIAHSVARATTLARWSGESAGEGFGFSVCTLVDASGDGIPDLAIGAPWRDGEHGQEGAVTLFSGAGWKSLRLLTGHQPGPPTGHRGCSWSSMRFGHTLHELPDVDGDCRSDLAVAAVGGYGQWGCTAGWVAIVSCGSGVRLRVLSGSSPI